jgi:asparagine synthase (glutamine-hydrolysing)
VDSITFSSISEEEDVNIALKSLKGQNNLRHHLIDREDLPLPYSRLEEAPLLDEPLSFLFMWSQIEKGLEYAKSTSSDLHLTGDGGDNVLQSSDAVYIASLLNRKTIPLFFSHSVGWARKRNQSPLSLMARSFQFRFISYTDWLSYQAQQLSFTSVSDSIWQWSGTLFRGNWITKEAKEWVSEKLTREAINLKPIHQNPSIHSGWTALFLTSSVARLTQQLGESLDMRIQFPYLDQSIVQTCFRVKSHERYHPKKFKPLIKEALTDILPLTLLNRMSKGNYTSDLFYGFRQHYNEIYELFHDSVLAKFGIIDLPLFYQSMEKVRAGLNIGLWELNATIAMELWLQKVKSRRETA